MSSAPAATAASSPATADPVVTGPAGSDPAAASTAATSPSESSPSRGRPGRRRLGQVLVAVVVLVAATVGLIGVVMLTTTTPAGGVHDNEPGGHAAIGQLLRDEGIDVAEHTRFADTVARAPGATVVVTNLGNVTPRVWERLVAARPARIVLLSPRGADLRRLGVDLRASSSMDVATVRPGCSDPLATRSGDIRLPSGSRAYEADEPVLRCYPHSTQGHFVLSVRAGDTEILAMPDLATNRDLAAAGNAALAMNLLGSRPTLAWWVAESGDPAMGSGGDQTGNNLPYPSLLPPGWIHAALLATVALVVIAIWRGRRLGPIMVEELPVVVAASETVEGHGRIYARLGARDTAAGHLRAAALSRLGRLLGHSDPEAIGQAVADRTGRPYPAVRDLLAGPPPATDDALVTLKRELDALEQEARRP